MAQHAIEVRPDLGQWPGESENAVSWEDVIEPSTRHEHFHNYLKKTAAFVRSARISTRKSEEIWELFEYQIPHTRFEWVDAIEQGHEHALLGLIGGIFEPLWGPASFEELLKKYANAISPDFDDVVELISWDFANESLFSTAIQLALELDRDDIALKLAKHGNEIYPDNENFAHLVHALNPPTVVRAKHSTVQGLNNSVKWFEKHSSRYRGYWVAIQRGELVAKAKSREELEKQLETLHLSNVLVERIS